MGELLAQVIPLALGAAISPLLFFGGVAVMTGPQPLRRGAAYATGASLPLLAATALALALGAALSPFYFPAMKLISESSASDEAKAGAVAVVIIVTLSLVLIPLAIVALAPSTSGRVLAAAGDWLGAHRRRLALVICFGLGAYLLVHGLARVL